MRAGPQSSGLTPPQSRTILTICNVDQSLTRRFDLLDVRRRGGTAAGWSGGHRPELSWRCEVDEEKGCRDPWIDSLTKDRSSWC